MKNFSRLTIAAVLVGILVVIATGVWAAPVFQGTVPNPPSSGSSSGGSSSGGSGGCTNSVVDMGTAKFTPDCPDIEVVKVDDPSALAAAPEGKAFFGDTFELTITGTGSVEVCFAYPTDFSNKEAKINKLDTSVNPAVWVEVEGAVTENGTICVDVTESGTFSLIGNQ